MGSGRICETEKKPMSKKQSQAAGELDLRIQKNDNHKKTIANQTFVESANSFSTRAPALRETASAKDACLCYRGCWLQGIAFAKLTNVYVCEDKSDSGIEKKFANLKKVMYAKKIKSNYLKNIANSPGFTVANELKDLTSKKRKQSRANSCEGNKNCSAVQMRIKISAAACKHWRKCHLKQAKIRGACLQKHLCSEKQAEVSLFRLQKLRKKCLLASTARQDGESKCGHQNPRKQAQRV